MSVRPGVAQLRGRSIAIVPTRPVGYLPCRPVRMPGARSGPGSSPARSRPSLGVIAGALPPVRGRRSPRALAPYHEPEKSMPDRTLSIDGVRAPRFLYGTAWKEDETRRLTELALRAGFRGIDTANQRRHYHEAAVGQAVAAAIGERPGGPGGPVPADQVHLPRGAGSPPALRPCGPHPGPGRAVVRQLARAPGHGGDRFLRAARPDRGGPAWPRPTGRPGGRWRRSTRAAGPACSASATSRLEQLDGLCQAARVRPRFVQNRCYAARGWDRDVRAFCAANGLVYQGFSLLTANREVLARPELARIARRHGRTVSQVVFRFALDVGMMALTGTTDPGHMRDDLDVFDFRLEPEEVERIERMALP